MPRTMKREVSKNYKLGFTNQSVTVSLKQSKIDKIFFSFTSKSDGSLFINTKNIRFLMYLQQRLVFISKRYVQHSY